MWVRVRVSEKEVRDLDVGVKKVGEERNTINI